MTNAAQKNYDFSKLFIAANFKIIILF